MGSAIQDARHGRRCGWRADRSPADGQAVGPEREGFLGPNSEQCEEFERSRRDLDERAGEALSYIARSLNVRDATWMRGQARPCHTLRGV